MRNRGFVNESESIISPMAKLPVDRRDDRCPSGAPVRFDEYATRAALCVPGNRGRRERERERGRERKRERGRRARYLPAHNVRYRGAASVVEETAAARSRLSAREKEKEKKGR